MFLRWLLAVAAAFLVPTSVWAQDPVHHWSQRFGDQNVEAAYAVAVDGSGNIIVTGHFLGTIDFGGGLMTAGDDYDIFVAKFGPSGLHLWSQRFGDDAYQRAWDVAVDSLDNVIVIGHLLGTVDFGGGPLISAGNDDIFVVKFDPSGSHLWSQRFGDADYQQAWGVGVDAPGNVIVAGDFLGSVDFGGDTLTSAGGHDIFVVKLDPSGSHLWSQRFGDADEQRAWGVAVDDLGDVIVSGGIEGTVDFGGEPLTSAGASDVFAVKLDPDGSHVWSQNFGDADQQATQAVAADGQGNVILAGNLDGTVDFGGGPLTSTGGSDIFAVKLDPSGSHLWSQSFGDGQFQHVRGLTTDELGNVTVAGFFDGEVDFGGGPLTSNGSFDIYVATLDPGGDHVWSRSFGDSATQAAHSVAADQQGSLFLTGWFESTVDFGGGPLLSIGIFDIFVARFGSETAGVEDRNHAPRFANALYEAEPNPANPSTRIRYSIAERGWVSLRIFDVSGRLLRTLVSGPEEPGGFDTVWDGTTDAAQRVSSGIYFYQLEAPGFRSTRKLAILK